MLWQPVFVVGDGSEGEGSEGEGSEGEGGEGVRVLVLVVSVLLFRRCQLLLRSETTTLSFFCWCWCFCPLE